jgi:CubicO group peptidase (beta-lactamase class C family)
MMRQARNFLPVAVLLSFLTLVIAIPPDVSRPATARRIEALVQQYAELDQFNGSILVVQNGELIVKKGYGMANFEWDIPNTAETRFRLGSITKQFTSMVIMQLVEQGLLSLDDKLADRLSYYRKDTGSKVSILQLLNHTSGIPSYTNIPNILKEHGRNPLALPELVKKWCSEPLEFEPGSRFAYNNSGYVILGAIIEEATGKSYEQVVKERIFEPVGMRASGYDRSEVLISRRAAGYENGPEGLRNADFIDMSLPHAAGALYSTVEDLFLWDQALYGTMLISEAGKGSIFTPGQASYGYGWFIRKAPVGPLKAERSVFQHGGSIPGFSSLIVRVPEDRLLIVLLNNTGSAPLTAISQGIGDLLFEREPQPPKRSVARTLQTTLKEKGIEAALAQYADIKAKNLPDYDLGQGELNQLGYLLLRTGRVDDAIAIFNANVEAFPKAWNVYDSLAEAYAAKGQKVLAIKNYALSIQLNPDNLNGIRKLHDLAVK